MSSIFSYDSHVPIHVDGAKDFDKKLEYAGSKLLVAYFSAPWCSPCRHIGPFYENLSQKYTNAVFLKIDITTCQELAEREKVHVIPAFIFYRNLNRIDKVQTVDEKALENKILRHYRTEEEDDGNEESTSSIGNSMEMKIRQKKKFVPRFTTTRFSKAINIGKKFKKQ